MWIFQCACLVKGKTFFRKTVFPQLKLITHHKSYEFNEQRYENMFFADLEKRTKDIITKLNKLTKRRRRRRMKKYLDRFSSSNKYLALNFFLILPT